MFELFGFYCEAIKNTKKAAEFKDELTSGPAVGAHRPDDVRAPSTNCLSITGDS